MCDETKEAKTAQTRDSRTESRMPDCCAPMAERMIKAFGSSEEGEVNGESSQDNGERLCSCASKMAEMASECCHPSPRKPTSDE